MFAVALVAPKWPIFKKHITSWHDLVVFSIGMEFVAYLGITTMASVGQTRCLPWERTAQLTRLAKPVWSSPLHIKERDATTLHVSPDLKATLSKLATKSTVSHPDTQQAKMSSTESRKPWFQNKDSLKSFQSRQENYFKEASKKNC